MAGDGLLSSRHREVDLSLLKLDGMKLKVRNQSQIPGRRGRRAATVTHVYTPGGISHAGQYPLIMARVSKTESTQREKTILARRSCRGWKRSISVRDAMPNR